MGQATIEIEVPAAETYGAPMLFSAGTENGGIPGNTETQWCTFSWSSTGFTGTDWWGTGIQNGPTSGVSETDIENGTENMNDLFAAWQETLRTLTVHEANQHFSGFVDAVDTKAPGCVSF